MCFQKESGPILIFFGKMFCDGNRIKCGALLERNGSIVQKPYTLTAFDPQNNTCDHTILLDFSAFDC